MTVSKLFSLEYLLKRRQELLSRAVENKQRLHDTETDIKISLAKAQAFDTLSINWEMLRSRFDGK